MKDRIYENGLEYFLIGDYYLPNVDLPNRKSIGKYSMLHEDFIKQYRPEFYSRLVLSDKLNDYLYEIDTRARNMVEDYIQATVLKQGVSEEIKKTDPLKWVGLMNNIKAQAEEFVFDEIVYA